MTFFKKYILLLFPMIFIVNSAISQSSLRKGDLEVHFLREDVEIEQGKSFFDILYLKNKTNKPVSFNVQFNTPRDWKIIGNSFEKITLQAYAESSLPVRVSLSKHIIGGVGYAVVAVINDEKGSVYNTVYTIVKIPVISSIRVKTNKTYENFNKKDLKSDFEISIENSGNIDELVNIKFIPPPNITVKKDYDELNIDNIEIKSGELKNIKYQVKLDKSVDYKKYRIHKLKVNINVHDSVIKKRIWFKYVDWSYKNIIPETKNPLNIELLAFNIFSNSKPVYIGKIFGDILLKNKKDIFYSVQNYNRKTNANLWVNSDIRLQFNSPKTTLFIGDYRGYFEHSMFGRGIYLKQKIGKNISIKGAVTKKLERNVENYGFSYTQNFMKLSSVELGGNYSDNPDFGNTLKLVYGKISTNILKTNVSVLYGKSYSQYHISNINNTYKGWGYQASLYNKIKNITINFNTKYGTPYYFGYYQGRLLTNGIVNIKLNKRKYLFFRYSQQNYRPVSLINSNLISERYTKFQRFSVSFRSFTKNNVSLYITPIIEESNTNNLLYLNPEDAFGTLNSSLEGGTSLNNKYTGISFSFSAKYGYTSVYKYADFLNGISFEGRTAENLFDIAQIRGSFKRRNFGINFIYYLGPYNISQQFAYFYSYIYSKSVIIIPFYEKDLLNNKVKIILRGTYINNLTSKISRINVNSEINWFAGKGWTFRFFNTTSSQRVNRNERSGSYSTTYFQFGINKSFSIQQPRLKYYNYQAVFYKDLNGNRIHDANEPGVSDVLTEINRANPEQDLQDKNYNGEFLSNELYSNEDGKIEYDNIAEGVYNIKYTPKDIQKAHYESEGTEKQFVAKKDTVMYIPFMERNKLFGKISLHRTKHSALGDIPLDNIKITVEGNDKTYSVLTDKDGSFEMYIPVSDYYKVKINNIFREHFDLRQEFYIVKFNGYKQFELSFDFDEKERKIHFDESDFLITDEEENGNVSFEDIKVIKQTNLRGIIKDANSLLPIHAVVSIFNNNTNELISETASSRRTGVYFTSFFAGDSYTIKVKALGYWTYTEDLYLNQVTTFDNVNRDILLRKTYIDEEIKTENLKFKSENSELSALAKAELDNLVSILFLNPDVIIEIGGHTDDMEALSINGKQLSETRAKAVAAYMKQHGLSEKRIKIRALSNHDPKSRLDTPEGRALNRRVSIIVAGF